MSGLLKNVSRLLFVVIEPKAALIVNFISEVFGVVENIIK